MTDLTKQTIKPTPKKLKDEQFKVPGGYVMLTGDWGIVNDNGEWVTFDDETPYTPVGGRKECFMATKEKWVASEVKYVKPMSEG